MDKKFLKYFFLVAVFLFAFSFWFTAKAANEQSVTATVTAQNLALTVADGSISYGTLGVGTSATTALNDGDSLDDSQSAVNTGNITEKFNIRGQNSSAWTLATNPGSETYSHDFYTSNCDISPSWSALTTSNQTLVASIGVGSTQNFDLRIRMPTSTSNYSSQSVDVTVQATTP